MKQATNNKKEEIQKWPLQTNAANEGGESNHVVIHNYTTPNSRYPSLQKTTGEMLSREYDISLADKNPDTKSKVFRDYHVILAKDSPKHNADGLSDDSTYDSLNYVETDLCRDSGDTETESDSSITARKFIMEYEVASSSSDAELYTDDSSSGEDELLIAAAVAANTLYLSSSSSIDSVYTGQDSTDPWDSELSPADYWYCVKCKNRQNNPMFRFCEKCYQIRKTHFPPRPTKRKSRSARKRNLSTLKEQPVLPTPRLRITDVRRNFSSPIYRDDEGLNFKLSHLKRKASNDGNFNNSHRSGKQFRCKKRRISYKDFSDSSTGEESSNCASDFYKNNLNPITKLIESNSETSTNNYWGLAKESQETSDISGDNMISNENNIDKLTTLKYNYNNRFGLHNQVFTNGTAAIDDVLRDSETDLLRDKLDLNSQKESGFSSGHSSQELPGVTINSTNSVLKNILSKDQNDSDSSDTVTEELEDDDIVNLRNDEIDSDTLKEELRETNKDEFTTYKKSNQSTNLLNGFNSMIEVNSIPNSLDRHRSELTQASLKNQQTLSQIVRSVSTCSDAYTNTSNADGYLSPKAKVVGLEANNPDSLENSQYGSCMTCLSEPKNGVFVHSRFLHLCCCYKCAVKIWNKNKKCPICNCAVKNVMKLFVH